MFVDEPTIFPDIYPDSLVVWECLSNMILSLLSHNYCWIMSACLTLLLNFKRTQKKTTCSPNLHSNLNPIKVMIFQTLSFLSLPYLISISWISCKTRVRCFVWSHRQNLIYQISRSITDAETKNNNLRLSISFISVSIHSK